MNWDDLRFFLAAARTGKLTDAGRQLGVDHATVSRRLRGLETSLSTTLFERKPTGHTLTEAGHELLAWSERVETNIESVREKISGGHRELTGPVRVAVPEGAGAFLVTGAAQSLCEDHPKLEVQLLANAQNYSLAKREADFKVAVSRPKNGRLKVQKISDYKLHLYGHKSYLAKFDTVRCKDDIKAMRGIAYVPNLIPDPELDYVSEIDPEFSPHLTSTSVHVQAAAIRQGAGVGMMHDFMAANDANLVRVLPDEISLTRTFWGIVHEDYADLERIRTVSSKIVEAMRKALKEIR